MPLYETLARTAIHVVKPDHVAAFVGLPLTGQNQDELGNDFHTCAAGTRLKPYMGPIAVKVYDKQALVLRIETTVSDVSFFPTTGRWHARDQARAYALDDLVPGAAARAAGRR